MAKKKSNANLHRQPAEDAPLKTVAEGRADNDAEMEKVKNLKSLNAVLVKQSHELRVERSSLMSVNKILEEEKVKLEKEKADVEDKSTMLDLEKDVMAVVAGARVGEMLKCGVRMVNGKEGVEKRLELVETEVENLRSEKGSVVRDLKALGEYSAGVEKERNALKMEVDVKSREVDVLNERLEMVGKEVDVLKSVKERAVRDLMELEKEKSTLHERLCEALAHCDNLEKQMGGLVVEKRSIELERNESLQNVEQLDKEVRGLGESVLVLQVEVQRLQEMVSELEKDNADLIQHRDGLSMEFSVLKEQNKGNEEQIRNLLLEKELLARNIDESASELEKTMRESEKVQALLQAEIAALHEAHKIEISEMEQMACQLRNKLEETRYSFETQIEEKKKLVTELKNLRIELEACIAEKVRAQSDIQLEKKNVQNLTQNLVDLELKVQERAKEIEQLGNEKTKLIEAKEAVEAKVELLVKEKDLVHKKLEEAEEDVVRANANTESMSEMRKQLEIMKHSVKEAQKRKSLWQLVSSATTVFAAASVVYISRRH